MSRAHTRRVLVIGAGVFAASLLAGPALAGHVHYVMTPNGACHEVASGQTSIAEAEHGGFHRFHANVHLGATGAAGTTGDDHLGMGNAAVALYKEGPAPAVCDGD